MQLERQSQERNGSFRTAAVVLKGLQTKPEIGASLSLIRSHDHWHSSDGALVISPHLTPLSCA